MKAMPLQDVSREGDGTLATQAINPSQKHMNQTTKIQRTICS
jgi:hypothetical protein